MKEDKSENKNPPDKIEHKEKPKKEKMIKVKTSEYEKLAAVSGRSGCEKRRPQVTNYV